MLFSSMPWPRSAEATAFALALLANPAQAQFTPISSPNLNLNNLGRVGLAGDFDAISVFSYREQNEAPFTTNGSQALLAQMPNGMFDTLVGSDGNVLTACPFVGSSGKLNGVVLGGNFTMLKSQDVQAVALWNPESPLEITPLPGLNGSVHAVHCDQQNNRVYVGGQFQGGSSKNAIIWNGGMNGWNDMAFEGFNGKINAIAKSPDSDNIIFAGQFTQLSNVTTSNTNSTGRPDLVVNLAGADGDVSAAESTDMAGFSDPKNIVCKTGEGGPGNTWLAKNNTRATWKVISPFGYEPTRLRLWQTRQPGYGTKTWRFSAFPGPGILNMSYTDPADGQNKTCDQECPLSNDTNVKFQDFYFVNVVGMTAFQLDFYDWYGSAAGLDGIELTQKANYVYANPNFNAPSCANTSFPATSNTTGTWVDTDKGQSVANFLTANLTGPGVNSNSASVSFYPTIGQAGTYAIKIYTPGCQPQGTCGQRGVANVTAVLTKDGKQHQMNIFQTNQFEKYDTLTNQSNSQNLYVDLPDGSFRPYVRIQPKDDQNSAISLVALRVEFELHDAANQTSQNSTTTSSHTFQTRELNGLYELNPNNATVDQDFSTAFFNRVGQNLSDNAEITSLANSSNFLFLAGNFSHNDYQNIFKSSKNETKPLSEGGLNGRVETLFAWGNLVFVGGNFTRTRDGPTAFANVAAYDSSTDKWTTLGGGVNGPVSAIVPLDLLIDGKLQGCLTLNGPFDKVLPSSGSNGFNATDGLAIWCPTYNNWLQNLKVPIPSIRGQLTTSANFTSDGTQSTLLAGTITSQGMAIQDVVGLQSANGNATINSLGLQEPQIAAQSQKTLTNKAVTSSVPLTLSGAVTGYFITDNNRNITVVAGNFQTNASNNTAVHNLVFIDTASDGSSTVTGITTGVDNNSTFLALARGNETLLAGGAVSGRVNGESVNAIISWDLSAKNFASQQPATLNPAGSHVNALTYRPSSPEAYAGGNFTSAGALPCAGLCVLNNGQWSQPGRGFAGTVNSMMWVDNEHLLVGGNITNGGNRTSLASFDATTQVWTTPNNAGQIPGPVNVLTAANTDKSRYWLAGVAENGTSFVMKFDGDNYLALPPLGSGSLVRGLAVSLLTQNHGDSSLIDNNQALIVSGQLNIPGFGNASAAIFNGTNYTPFILSNAGNGPGSMSQLFSEKVQDFNPDTEHHLALGFIVLIALAIALGLIFLIVVAGMLLERYRRRAEGYRPAPQNYVEKTANMGRIPPDQLLGNLSRGTEGPRI